MENIGRGQLLDMLEKLRTHGDWRKADTTRDVLEQLLVLLIDGEEGLYDDDEPEEAHGQNFR